MRAKPNKKLRGATAGKGTLDAFFTQPAQFQSSQSPSHPSPQSQSQENKIIDDPPSSDADPCAASSSLASDYQLALRLSGISHSQDDNGPCTPGFSQTMPSLDDASMPDSGSNLNPKTCPTASGSKAAWSKLMAPVEPPKCNVHGEPAKLYTVNKQGPNKGKTFFLCSRYVLAPLASSFRLSVRSLSLPPPIFVHSVTSPVNSVGFSVWLFPCLSIGYAMTHLDIPHPHPFSILRLTVNLHDCVCMHTCITNCHFQTGRPGLGQGQRGTAT